MKNQITRPSWLLPTLLFCGFTATAQQTSINQGKITSEETFKVCAKNSKKHYRYFSAQSPVTMADGSVKSMSEVRVGDYVQTCRNGKRLITQVQQVDVYNYPTSPLTAVYLRPINETVASTEITGLVPALVLEATPYHHVQTDKGRKRVKNLSKKDMLMRYEPATGEIATWQVAAVKVNALTVNKAYNLETEEGTYLVENVVVHNR